MFDSHSSKVLPPRIQHLAWRSHQYDFLIVHITGNANAADLLSRLPSKRDDCSDSGLVCENYVPFVYTSNMSDLQAVTLSDMKFETSKDATLSKLLVEIQSGKWSHEQQLKGAVVLMGPIDGKYILTYIDYYSSYPEACVLKRDNFPRGYQSVDSYLHKIQVSRRNRF